MRVVQRRERALEPWMLVGGVVGYQVHEHLQAQIVGALHEPVEVVQGPILRVYVNVVSDVVAVVLLR